MENNKNKSQNNYKTFLSVAINHVSILKFNCTIVSTFSLISAQKHTETNQRERITRMFFTIYCIPEHFFLNCSSQTLYTTHDVVRASLQHYSYMFSLRKNSISQYKALYQRFQTNYLALFSIIIQKTSKIRHAK